jgi:hypothetical protein
MNTDPITAQIADYSATAAQLAAAVCSGDSWEWESILDEATDINHCKRLLVAMARLYVRHVLADCARTGADPSEWLHECAMEQLAVAKQMHADHSTTRNVRIAGGTV